MGSFVSISRGRTVTKKIFRKLSNAWAQQSQIPNQKRIVENAIRAFPSLAVLGSNAGETNPHKKARTKGKVIKIETINPVRK